MALSRADRSELMLPLFAGLFETPLWHTFLRNLAARTGADRVHLITRGREPKSPSLHHRAVASLADPARFSARDERAAINALALAAMRTGRVYALDELRDFDSSGRRARQEARFAAARIGDAQLMRVVGGGGYAVWLVVLSERARFDAADSVLLSDLAPAVEVALMNHVAAGNLRLRTEAAEAALARLGIAQAVLDPAGHVVVRDALWRRSAAPSPAQLEEQAIALFADPVGEPRIARSPAGVAIVRRFAGEDHPFAAAAAGLASVRAAPASLPAAACAIAAEQFGLSRREAALAVALAEGRRLTAAGQALGLSEETTRNYSKRIYSKTGAHGQADLVRMILSSVAVLG